MTSITFYGCGYDKRCSDYKVTRMYCYINHEQKSYEIELSMVNYSEQLFIVSRFTHTPLFDKTTEYIHLQNTPIGNISIPTEPIRNDINYMFNILRTQYKNSQYKNSHYETFLLGFNEGLLDAYKIERIRTLYNSRLSPDSPFYKDYFPRDLFKIICDTMFDKK